MVCRITADLSGLAGTLQKRKCAAGPYWTINYDLAIKFCDTEFQAFVQWTEKVGLFLDMRPVLVSDILLNNPRGCNTSAQHLSYRKATINADKYWFIELVNGTGRMYESFALT